MGDTFLNRKNTYKRALWIDYKQYCIKLSSVLRGASEMSRNCRREPNQQDDIVLRQKRSAIRDVTELSPLWPLNMMIQKHLFDPSQHIIRALTFRT